MSKLKVSLAVLTLAVSFAFSSIASASMMTGGLTFTGSLTHDGTSLANATTVTFLNPVSVQAAVGSFVGEVGVANTTFASPWNFAAGGAVAKLWQTPNFYFDLASSFIETQLAGSLSVVGPGIIYGGGYDPTPGTFRLSTQAGLTTLSFSASTIVPEPGTILIWSLLGGLGLVVGRRFKK